MELREISRLDAQSARELLFAYTTDLKRNEKDKASALSDKALWESRVSLAESKGAADLAAAARGKLADATAKIASIDTYVAEIKADISRIKDALPRIVSKERSIDPDRLLAELQLLTGELLDPDKAKLDRAFSSLEKDSAASAQTAAGEGAKTAAGIANASGVESTLDALKRKMGLGK